MSNFEMIGTDALSFDIENKLIFEIKKYTWALKYVCFFLHVPNHDYMDASLAKNWIRCPSSKKWNTTKWNVFDMSLTSSSKQQTEKCQNDKINDTIFSISKSDLHWLRLLYLIWTKNWRNELISSYHERKHEICIPRANPWEKVWDVVDVVLCRRSCWLDRGSTSNNAPQSSLWRLSKSSGRFRWRVTRLLFLITSLAVPCNLSTVKYLRVTKRSFDLSIWTAIRTRERVGTPARQLLQWHALLLTVTVSTLCREKCLWFWVSSDFILWKIRKSFESYLHTLSD